MMTTTPPDDPSVIDSQERSRADAVVAAFQMLVKRFGVPGNEVGPSVTAVANAAFLLTPAGAGMRRPGDRVATLDEIRAALRLLPRFLEDVEAAERHLIGAARSLDNSTPPKPLMTWKEIGMLLGYPEASAKQAMLSRARRLGIFRTIVTEGD